VPTVVLLGPAPAPESEGSGPEAAEPELWGSELDEELGVEELPEVEGDPPEIVGDDPLVVGVLSTAGTDATGVVDSPGIGPKNATSSPPSSGVITSATNGTAGESASGPLSHTPVPLYRVLTTPWLSEEFTSPPRSWNMEAEASASRDRLTSSTGLAVLDRHIPAKALTGMEPPESETVPSPCASNEGLFGRLICEVK